MDAWNVAVIVFYAAPARTAVLCSLAADESRISVGATQEAQSPFCWLCERPQRLVVPQKMPGQRRIWRLPSKQMVAGMQRALKVLPMTARCH